MVDRRFRRRNFHLHRLLGFLRDDALKTYKVIGYGPRSNLLPFVPEYLIVETGGTISSLRRDGSTSEYFEDDSWSGIKERTEILESEWVAVEETGVNRFLKTEESTWRSRRSQELVELVGQIKGDPVRVIRLIHTSSMLQKLDIGGLSRRLHMEKKSSDQPLTSVYETIRKSLTVDEIGLCCYPISSRCLPL